MVDIVRLFNCWLKRVLLGVEWSVLEVVVVFVRVVEIGKEGQSEEQIGCCGWKLLLFI